MGYYSNFEVVDTDIDDIVDVLNNYTDPYEWEEPYLGYVKWYDWEDDLRQIAYAYPNNYLIVLRFGEDDLDMERAVVRDGTVVFQRPNVSWPSL